MDKNSKVPFDQKNNIKCACSECPIEISSQCAKDKIEKEKEIIDTEKTKVQKAS